MVRLSRSARRSLRRKPARREPVDADLATLAVREARAKGAEYCEARLHTTRGLGAILRDGTPEPAVVSEASGLGLRLLYRGALSFAATNRLNRTAMKDLVEEALAQARAAAARVRRKVRFADTKPGRGRWRADERQRLENVQLNDLLGVLSELDRQIRQGSHGVAFPSRLLTLETLIEEKEYVNSDGADLQSRVPRLKFESYVTARYAGRTTSLTIPPGYAQAGESGGWEVLKRLALPERVPEHVRSLAGVVRSEARLPPTKLDVVLGPEICGLVAHESSGHAGEADRVLGREAAQAGESYLRKGDLGRKVGSKEAYASDDPTLPHSMGFYAYDDEGVPARKRALIRAGIITEFLHNRATAYEFGLASNAASRAVEFDREPIVRMANTFIEPGDWTLPEMLADIRDGLLMRSFMEWNIDDQRFNQRYVGLEAFRIKNGEVGAPVRDPVLEVTTSLFWGSIDARGKELGWTAGMCGKGDPMQGIPVWLGGPYVRLRGIRVASR